MKDLMTPRWEVIADYPDSNKAVGTIIEIPTDKPIEWQQSHKSFYDRYPHLFKPLLWHEKRLIDDMPDYVKHKSTGDVFSVCWHSPINNSCIPIFKDNSFTMAAFIWAYHRNDYIPATQSEYEAYINSKI